MAHRVIPWPILFVFFKKTNNNGFILVNVR